MSFNMVELFRKLPTNEVYYLKVDQIHKLYIEESGNPNGIPVIFLHGGPGVGTSPDNRRYFDPNMFRIILYDQRGAGKSKPHATLERNNTQLLVSDLETIREFLKIDRWVLFGGSWGSTLALVYAETYPDKVLSMILRGVFLARAKDFAWLYKPGGASQLFPDYWRKFVNHLSAEERKNVLESYYKRLISESGSQLLETAIKWAEWEGSFISLQPMPEFSNKFIEPHTAISLARIEAHYFANQCFLIDNQILAGSKALKQIPGIIVHGRYDIVCPLDNAFQLNKVWKNSELDIVMNAGHAPYEPGIISALIKATNKVGKQIHL